jgi:type I restriction enzyme M protein
MLGDVYEKFKEEEVGNQGKKAGQYFTARTVIKYCVNDLLKPNATDLCYEPTCGTGGFIHFLTKYVYDNDKNKLDIFKKNIWGNDKTPEIMKALYINLFLHGIPIDNIKNKNSLNSVNCMDMFEKFDCIAGNPPYGVKNKIDPNDFYSDVIDKDKKICYFPKFMHSKKNELIKDSMGQFMIHIINSLKVGGKFVLVIDRGILNNGTESDSWQKELRKWLLMSCDIQVITLLPKGIFTSTMFDTAVIYGIKKISKVDSVKNNNTSTNKIKIFEGEFEDVKNKKGLKVVKLLKEITIKDIINNEWSLKYDDYIEKKENLHVGFLLVETVNI